MKRLLLLIAIVGGAIAVIRRLPAEQREGLAQLPASMMGRMMEHCMEIMPEDSPPKVMMSSLRRLQEQNEQILGILRERLPAQDATSPESSAPSADPPQG